MTALLNDPLEAINQFAHIPVDDILLEGELHLPQDATAVVVFAHSSRHSPRNQIIAEELAAAGFGTLLVDLLTPDEQQCSTVTGVRRFDIELLAHRLAGVVYWLENQAPTCHLKVGFVGAGIGAAAAIIAGVELGDRVSAIVSRGGRPDLAGPALSKVKNPTLLIVGGNEGELVMLNEDAFAEMRWRRDLRIIPGTNHRFNEPGKLQHVARLTTAWFGKYMGGAAWRDQQIFSHFAA